MPAQNAHSIVPDSKAPDASRPADDTRHRLVLAAARVFGEHGFEGASTRQIAALAQTNISSIAYHFGGKEKLYLAVAEEMAQKIGTAAELFETRQAGKLEKVRNGTLAPDEAVVMLQQLWGEWLDKIFAGEKHEREWKWFIIREQIEPTKAFDRIYDAGIGRFLNIIAALVGCIEGRSPASLPVKLHAFTLFGQMIAFDIERATVARYLGPGAFEDQEVKAGFKAAIDEGIARLYLSRR